MAYVGYRGFRAAMPFKRKAPAPVNRQGFRTKIRRGGAVSKVRKFYKSKSKIYSPITARYDYKSLALN